jgi:Arc/MetJ-type ribon-helix-helix transcriptional regulator
MESKLEQAIAVVQQLPAADQERIGQDLLEHVAKLRWLREAVEEGIRSLDAGEGRELDIEEFLARMHREHAGG